MKIVRGMRSCASKISIFYKPENTVVAVVTGRSSSSSSSFTDQSRKKSYFDVPVWVTLGVCVRVFIHVGSSKRVFVNIFSLFVVVEQFFFKSPTAK